MRSSAFSGTFMTIKVPYGLNITDLTLPEKHIRRRGLAPPSLYDDTILVTGNFYLSALRE